MIYAVQGCGPRGGVAKGVAGAQQREVADAAGLVGRAEPGQVAGIQPQEA